MTCDEIRLEEFHDGELAGSASADVQAHVAACARCAGELDELRRLEKLLASAPAGDRPGEHYVEQVRERLRVSGRVRWKVLLPLGAAAALMVALVRIMPAEPQRTDYAALIDAYSAAPPDAKRAFEEKFRDAEGVDALKRLIDDASPRRQAAAGFLLARHPDKAVHEWLVNRATEDEPADDWSLMEIGAEPADDELAGFAFELLRSPRTRDEAVRILRKLHKGGLNRAAHQAIVQRVKTLLASPVPADQELALEMVRLFDVKFLLPDLADLLEAPVIGEKAHGFLKEQTKKDFGRDRKAWKAFFDRGM